MSRSNRPKEKYGKSTELYLDNFKEGTAARTRPFSFDEIMLRRKDKKLYGDVKDGAGEEGNISRKDVVKNISDRYESDRGYKHNKDSFPGAIINHSSEDFVKVSSRKKDENTSMNEGNLSKVKDKESRNSEDKLKAKANKGMTDEAKERKIAQRVHGRKKVDERSRRSSDDSESESEKKFSRDSVGKDRYADRSRKSEKESKRKHQTGEDEKNRDKNSMKKHDPGKRHESEFSDRKERRESLPSRYGESKPKRRRSRSRERDKERDRRSGSLSPRAQKRTSYHGREHAEVSSHSLKDRSGRQHSDADRNRISNNGSSNHFRRHGGFASGLGGYSPRKRRTEAAIKTPSPTNRSPEKKSAGWDLPPARRDDMNAGSVLSNLQLLKPTVSSNADELPSAVPVSVPVTATTAKPLPRIYSDAVSTNKNVSIDSIQLTQASRPMRRLYVENLPASSSEKALMECLNNFLLSSGVNHVQGTQPCISCIIHKEKGQALVEFLTPEDASAALSFDSISFSGSILKIRRPKDFVDMTGVQEKLVAAPDAISDIVKDSPYKIFIGGISRVLSYDMLMEIATAFGPLKAYRFQVNEDLGERCAFLEYVDQSVTSKACVGLNGMKLGGQVLTVVQAIPNALAMENTGNLPFYGIPEHAKPLLERPTQVLKLKNVVNPDDLSSLSEPELEEILEDIRLECTRFGTVKSVNIVKYNNSHVSTLEAYEAADNTGSDLGCDGNSMKAETLGGGTDNGSRDISGVEPHTVVERNSISDDKSVTDLTKNELCETSQVDSNMAVKEQGCPDESGGIPRELPDQLNNKKHEVELHNDKVADVMQEDFVIENKLIAAEELRLEETNRKLLGTSAELDSSPGIESDFTGKNDHEKGLCDLDNVFEVGCVLVEYGRTEASCMAAHCLHGRYFDDRVVVVGYVALDLYRMKFPR